VDRTIQYAINGNVHIAYQVVGEGPIDLVYTPGIWSNLEIMWEWPLLSPRTALSLQLTEVDLAGEYPNAYRSRFGASCLEGPLANPGAG
jgi:hypothetical protein